jgi:hypothetical protein
MIGSDLILSGPTTFGLVWGKEFIRLIPKYAKEDIAYFYLCIPIQDTSP